MYHVSERYFTCLHADGVTEHYRYYLLQCVLLTKQILFSYLSDSSAQGSGGEYPWSHGLHCSYHTHYIHCHLVLGTNCRSLRCDGESTGTQIPRVLGGQELTVTVHPDTPMEYSATISWTTSYSDGRECLQQTHCLRTSIITACTCIHTQISQATRLLYTKSTFPHMEDPLSANASPPM